MQSLALHSHLAQWRCHPSGAARLCAARWSPQNSPAHPHPRAQVRQAVAASPGARHLPPAIACAAAQAQQQQQQQQEEQQPTRNSGREGTAPPPSSSASSRQEAGAGPQPTVGGRAGGASSAALAALPPDELKRLQKEGLAIKDRIKLGRRGVGEGLVRQVQARWNTSEVARLYCHGKQAADMKALVAALESATGGLVVFRAGGTVLLYRGRPAQQPAQVPEQQAQ